MRARSSPRCSTRSSARSRPTVSRSRRRRRSPGRRSGPRQSGPRDSHRRPGAPATTPSASPTRVALQDDQRGVVQRLVGGRRVGVRLHPRGDPRAERGAVADDERGVVAGVDDRAHRGVEAGQELLAGLPAGHPVGEVALQPRRHAADVARDRVVVAAHLEVARRDLLEPVELRSGAGPGPRRSVRRSGAYARGWRRRPRRGARRRAPSPRPRPGRGRGRSGRRPGGRCRARRRRWRGSGRGA